MRYRAGGNGHERPRAPAEEPNRPAFVHVHSHPRPVTEIVPAHDNVGEHRQVETTGALERLRNEPRFVPALRAELEVHPVAPAARFGDRTWRLHAVRARL